ncbi:Mu transposase domain-containing protein [Streptomyces actinomycinicus]|uniref:Mu transposase domain-containing protein n=1 Tax=Streptomyces actinomycinicus TaxID=1695166 RepID=UPI0035F2D407
MEEFDVGLTLTPKVDKTSRITVRQNRYSVPARFIGQNVRVSLRADEVWVFERQEIVVRHPRLAGRYGFRDLLDHYLEILRYMPGALENSTGLAAARESGQFTPVHAFWAAAREARGRAEGTRALIDVLLLHRHLPHEAVVAGISAVLAAGSVSPDLVAIEARKALAAAGGPPPVVITPPSPPAEDAPEDQDTGSARVISLPARRPVLPPDTRPEPSLAAYGQLLSQTPKGSA